MSYTIALVDDDRDVHVLFSALLTDEDFAVHTFERGEDLLQWLESNEPVVCLSDDELPDMDGLEVLELVRRTRPSCQRILITGRTDIQSMQIALNAGTIQYFLAKPWHNDEVIATIDGAVTRHIQQGRQDAMAALLQRQNDELDTLARQLKGFDERLELVQVDRGLTEADKEHYDGALIELESRLAKLKEGVKEIVQTVNSNGEVCNDHFVKVARLFQFLAAHIHDGDGVVAVSPENLLKAEVELANKRLGKIEGQPTIIRGRNSVMGYCYLENIGLSVREKE